MLTRLEKNRTISLIITIIIAMGIYFFSTMQSAPIDTSSTFNLTYVYHFVIFFLFGLFLLITIKGENETETKHMIIVLIIAILYAALDEFHQSFTPGRNVSVIDLLVDTAGITFAVIFYDKIKEMKVLKKLGLRKKRKNQ